MTIQKYLLAGIMLVVVATSCSALYSLFGINRLDALIVALYEKPFMANSFSQSAIIHFHQLQNMTRNYVIEFSDLSEEEKEEHLEEISDKFDEVVEDLEIVLERAVREDAQKLVNLIVSQLENMQIVEKLEESEEIDDPEIAMAQYSDTFVAIGEELEQLVELTFEQGYLFSENARSLSDTIFLWTIVAATLAFAIGIISAFGLGYLISRPLKKLTESMTKLSGNDLSCNIPYVRSSKELKHMSDALLQFREAALDKERLKEEQDRAAERAKQDKTATIRQMADVVEEKTNEAVGDIVESTNQVDASLRRLSESSGDISQTAELVSQNARQTLVSTESLNRAGANLRQSIMQIRDEAGQSKQAAFGAVERVNEAESVIAEVMTKAENISEITDIIEGITSRITLLSLNAKIEAVHAGEAGHGFAIVADSVGDLAEQTRISTERAALQIAEMIEVSATAVQNIARIVDAIGSVEKSATEISDLVDMQTEIVDVVQSNIAETEQNANEVAEGMVNVQTVVRDVGGDVNAIEGVFQELGRRVNDLSSTIVEVVRSSMAEANRRKFKRLAANERCFIQLGTLHVDGRICDASEGGISLIVEDNQGLALGEPCKCVIESLKHECEGIVVSLRGSRVGIKFNKPDGELLQKLGNSQSAGWHAPQAA